MVTWAFIATNLLRATCTQELSSDKLNRVAGSIVDWINKGYFMTAEVGIESSLFTAVRWVA